MGVVGYLKHVESEKLERLIKGEIEINDYIYEEVEGIKSLYIDKFWHSIHYIINGKAWDGEEPLVDVILGGTPIGDDDGNGPTRYLTSSQVQIITSELIKLKGPSLVSRYKPKKMELQEIYPSIDWKDSDTKQYMFDNYWNVVDYYKEAAEKGYGMLLYLN